jgi:hypothetical protein
MASQIFLSPCTDKAYSDNVSRAAITAGWGDQNVNETTTTTTKQQPSKTEHSITEVATGYRSRGTTQDVNNLKQQIVDRAREAGFAIDSSLFPWKLMLELLAKSGFYLMGWPYNSRMPGQAGTEKGISGLRAQEQTAVFSALANTKYPLKFVRYEGNPRGKGGFKIPSHD